MFAVSVLFPWCSSCGLLSSSPLYIRQMTEFILKHIVYAHQWVWGCMQSLPWVCPCSDHSNVTEGNLSWRVTLGTERTKAWGQFPVGVGLSCCHWSEDQQPHRKEAELGPHFPGSGTTQSLRCPCPCTLCWGQGKLRSGSLHLIGIPSNADVIKVLTWKPGDSILATHHLLGLAGIYQCSSIHSFMYAFLHSSLLHTVYWVWAWLGITNKLCPETSI